MKLSDLIGHDGQFDARFAALDLSGVASDSRKVKPGHLFVAVPGTKADGLSLRAAGARGGRGGDHGGRRAETASRRHRVRARRQRAARARARGGALPSAPAGNDRGGDRHQRQDLGRGVHAADLGRARPRGGEHRHHRSRDAEAGGLRLAHHARSDRACAHARPAGRGRHHASRDGGVFARARSASHRRRAGDGRRASPTCRATTWTITRPSRPISTRS